MMRHLEDGFRLLDHEARLGHLADLQALRAQIDAQEQYLLHVLATERTADLTDDEWDKEWVREEVACVLRAPGGTTHAKFNVARELVTRLPQTLDALARGELSFAHAHARALADAVRPLTDTAATEVQTRVLAARRPRRWHSSAT